jgi:hypothetical protein
MHFEPIMQAFLIFGKVYRDVLCYVLEKLMMALLNIKYLLSQ